MAAHIKQTLTYQRLYLPNIILAKHYSYQILYFNTQYHSYLNPLQSSYGTESPDKPKSTKDDRGDATKHVEFTNWLTGEL